MSISDRVRETELVRDRESLATTSISERPAETRRQTDELADVVIAMDSRDDKGKPWFIRLRPWLFCLFFLLMVEGATRVEFDGTVCLHEERFDNFPNPAALDAYVGQIKRDKAFRVVVLGDSVVVGPSLLDKDETIPAYLEAALKRQHPGRDIHVWNLGLAGARSTDLYCMLVKLLDASPDLVVIESNFMMYTMDIRVMPVANTWVAYSLARMPEPIRPLVPNLDYKQKIDNATTWFVERNFRFFGLRQAINGMLFGVQPRVPFDSPNPAVMLTTKTGKALGRLPMEPWSTRGVSPITFRGMYSNAVQTDNLNGRFYPLMMDELLKSHTPALFYMTPQNPALMSDMLPGDAYTKNLNVALSFITSRDFLSRDYSNLVPDRLFYDNDHLLAGGNRMVGESIARDIEPLVEKAIGGDRQPGGSSAGAQQGRPKSSGAGQRL